MSSINVAESTPPISTELDRLSLEQALRDFEVANARVIDLTTRLTEAHAELQQLRQQQLAAVATAPAVARPAGGTLRSVLAPPVKAIARRVLPLSVRVRIRSALR